MLNSDGVWQVIANLPFLREVWDQKYVSEDSQEGFKQPWLNRLAENPDQEILTELKKLDTYLGTIITCPGFPKLRPGLRARNIEQFASTEASGEKALAPTKGHSERPGSWNAFSTMSGSQT